MRKNGGKKLVLKLAYPCVPAVIVAACLPYNMISALNDGVPLIEMNCIIYSFQSEISTFYLKQLNRINFKRMKYSCSMGKTIQKQNVH